MTSLKNTPSQNVNPLIPRRPNKIRLLFILALIVLGLSLSLGIAPYQLDDAFITYRYAANVVDGYGPVFNPGTEPVEGFSSPLWMILLSLGALILGVPSLPVLGMALGLAGFILCYVSVFFPIPRTGPVQRDLSIATMSDWLPALLLSVLPTTVFYAVTGMESVLFLAVLIFFFRAVNHDIEIKWGLTAGFLSTWIRPEGAWFIPAMLLLLLGRGELKRILEKANLLLAGSVILGNAILIGIRFLIFKSILPNTYFAKEPWLKAGWLYLKETMSADWAIFILLLALLGAWMGDKRHRGYFLAGLSWLLAVLFEGGDWMPAGRLLLPAFGLFLMASSGIFKNRSLNFSEKKISQAKKFLTIAVILVILTAVFVNLTASFDIQKKARLSQSHSAFLEKVLADWVSKSGARSLGSADIGLMGFYPRIEMVDFAGLTDRVIGRSPGFHLEKQFDLSYIFERRKPDLILLRVSRKPDIFPNGRIRSRVKSKIENRIIRHPDFRETYQFLFAILPPLPARPYYGKLVFGRKSFIPEIKALPPNRVITVSSQ